jgi:hypothetical protein
MAVSAGTGRALGVLQSNVRDIDSLQHNNGGTIGFYGATPIVQRAGAAQATSAVGTASSTDVTTNLKAAVIELMNTMAALGLWKGGA